MIDLAGTEGESLAPAEAWQASYVPDPVANATGSKVPPR